MIIKKFDLTYIEEAAGMFIKQYNRLKINNNELPNKYSSINVISNMLYNTITKNPSVMVIKDNMLVGYMTGICNIKELKGSKNGVYIPEWAHCSLKYDEHDIYYAMYSYLAKEWVKLKNYTHAITILGDNDALIDYFNVLGFGMLVIDGLRKVDSLGFNTSAEYTFREANEGDVVVLRKMYFNINEHLQGEPIFLYNNNKELTDREILSNFVGENIKTIVAIKDNEVVAGIRLQLNKGPGCKIVQDNGTLGINFAYTFDNYRGKGLASLLLEEALKWGLNSNMKRCVVDFESQNREAFRFWLKYFKPICKTMIRKIDDRF